MNPREHGTLRLGLHLVSLGALLALGPLAAAGCSDDASPPDASRPPDASKPPDASTPPDATGSPDASAPFDASLPDASAIDAMVAFSCGDLPDSLEPNDTAAAAPIVQPGPIYVSPPSILAGWSMIACLSGDNEDWYKIASSQIDWEGDGGGEGIHMQIRFFARNTGYCEGVAICSGEQLPDAPETTVSVELYNAATMQLLSSGTSAFGVVRVNGGGRIFAQDFLVRVHGPPEALYDYGLSITLTTIDGEDECEC
jgi:hypothetical protein